MKYLYSLLFIPFSYGYYWIVGVMFRYITYGESGARYLRQQDELRKKKKSHIPLLFLGVASLERKRIRKGAEHMNDCGNEAGNH